MRNTGNGAGNGAGGRSIGPDRRHAAADDCESRERKKGGGKRSRTCEAAGCLEHTNEGKPYCTEHVDRHPYVAALLAQLGRGLADCSRESGQEAEAA